VWAIRRTAGAAPDGVCQVAADLTVPSTYRSLPGRFDALVYCPSAGGKGDPARYRAVYAEGLSRLLRSRSFRRLVLVSSTGVYGQRNGEWVTEDSETVPPNTPGRAMLEAEAVAADADVPSTVLRLSGIYGPGRTRLVRQVREGRIVCVRGRPRFLNQIHQDDCAGALAWLLFTQNPGSLYIGSDREPAARYDVCRWIADRLPGPAPLLVEPGDPRTIDDGRGNKRCCSQRLIDAGYRFRYPTFREGYAPLVSAERSRSSPP
jgi:nucleoside-diphosphate-sugar epimerase